jgi:hypothetical protein
MRVPKLAQSVKSPKPPKPPRLPKPKLEPKTIALTADSLERLGAARLAQLVLELSSGSAVIKRRLKIELSGPDGAGRGIAKRLATIGKSKSYIDWRKVRVVHCELMDQRAAIMTLVAPSDPGAALELMWQFMGLATPLLDRTFDMNGTLVALFVETLPMLAELAVAAKPMPGVLAGQIRDCLLLGGSGTYDGLITLMAPMLGKEGLLRLRELFLTVLDDEALTGARDDYKNLCQAALRDIADAQSDIDAYVATFAPTLRQLCNVSAQIGQRLLKAGRAGEALAYLDASAADAAKGYPLWESVRADTLEALGHKQKAQAFRLACFERNLNADLLRAYIKRLPDFDDEEALDKALLYAQYYLDLTKAISFLIAWPALSHASTRIIKDARKLDGNDYEWPTDLARTLDDKHPLAATLARRAMIHFALTKAKTKRYKYVARHIRECAASTAHIDDWHGHEDHQNWLAPLIDAHPRKFEVWDLV